MSYSPRYAPRAAVGRRTGLVAVLLLAMLALSGCLNVELKATVRSNNTVSGAAKIGIAKNLAALGGPGNTELLDQLKAQHACEFGGKSSSKDYDDGTYVGVECTFSGVTLAQFNSGEDGPQLARVGDTFQLTGRLNLLDALLGGGLPGSQASSAPSGVPTDLSSLLPSGLPTDLSSLLPSGLPTDLSSLLPSDFPTDALPSALPSDLSSMLSTALPSDLRSLLPSGPLNGLDPSSLLRTAKVSFAFTFPGKVRSSKGQVHGNTVSFTSATGGVIDFQTTAGATAPSGLAATSYSTRLGFGVAVLLALILLAVALVLIRRRRTQPVPAAGYPASPDYPTQDHQAPPGYPSQPDYLSQPGYPSQPAANPEPYTGPPQQYYPPTEQLPQPPTANPEDGKHWTPPSPPDVGR